MAAEAIPGKSKQALMVFDSEEEVAVALAEYTAELSEKFVHEKGAFTAVLSGGTLIDTMRKLTEPPYLDSVDWSKWHVFWVDERVVPRDHKDSNYKLAFDGFLSKVSIPSNQVYAINDTISPLSPEAAAEDYETVLRNLVDSGTLPLLPATGYPRFDLMLLGMGPDGHIASLFPGHPLLKEASKWVTYIKDSPKPPPERITFTLPVLNSSAYVAMVVTGAGETNAVAQALGNEKSASGLLPVQMASLEDGEFTWFTDKAAVSKLHDKVVQTKSRTNIAGKKKKWDTATHMKKDETYHNEVTQSCEKIDVAEQKCGTSSVAENDLHAQVLGKEDSSGVRGMGFRVSPSQVFTGSSSRANTVRSRLQDQDDEMIRVDRQEYADLRATVFKSRRCIELLFKMVKEIYGDSVDVPPAVSQILQSPDPLPPPPPPPPTDREFVPSTQDRNVGSDEETEDWSD